MRKKIKYVILGLLLVVMLGAFIYGFTYAKYVYNKAQDYYLKSRKFYFNSDYLGTDTVTNINNLWDLSSVYFNVRNNMNESVATNYNINYDVECSIEGDASNHLSCGINGTGLNNISDILYSTQECINNTNDLVDVSSYDETSCLASNYNWGNKISTNDIYFDIIKTDEAYDLKDVTVNIKVTSTAPYKKVLNGVFKLHKKETEEVKVSASYDEYENYGRLNIYNTSEVNKCVQISFDSSKLKIDSINQEFNSYLTDSNNYINSITVSINSKKGKSYIFYKDNSVYSIESFTITEVNTC